MLSVSREILNERGDKVTIAVSIDKDGGTKIYAQGPDISVNTDFTNIEAKALTDVLNLASDNFHNMDD